MNLQVISLLSRDIGAAIMAGVIFSIFYMIFQYFSSKRKAHTSNENHSSKQRWQEETPIDNKKSLTALRKKGIISEDEFNDKINQIRESELQLKINKTEDYQHLTGLLKSNIITKVEFENKIEILRDKIKKKDEQEINNRNKGYTQIGEYIEGRAKVWNKNDSYGFIDESDNLIVPCQYEFAEDFSEGFAIVRNDGKFGYINKVGSVILPIVYEDARSFYNGIAKVKLDGRFIFINQEGGQITLNMEQKQAFENRNIINFETSYIKSGFSLRMGSYDEFIIENSENGLEFTIYKNILNEKYYMYTKNEGILLFPNKRTCIKYISENLVN